MSTKAGLKAAKAAIDAQDYAKAIIEAQKILTSDSQNYFAKLFLARAQEKQGQGSTSRKHVPEHQMLQDMTSESAFWKLPQPGESRIKRPVKRYDPSI